MALSGSKINNFDDLWCLGALEGLKFRLASTASKRKVIKTKPDIS